MKTTVVILILPAVLLVALQLWLVVNGWRDTARLVDDVRSAPAPVVRTDLPEIVRAYARRNMLGARVPARWVALTQDAELRQQKGGAWGEVSARQSIASGAPAFVWDARQKTLGLTMARVVDSFASGTGMLEVRIAGGYVVARAEGPDIDASEAMRYLAELPWNPDAILGNPELIWQVLDDARVTVSVMVNGQPVAFTFTFENGDIVSGRSDARPALENGKTVLRPWVGTFSDYGEIGGRRVPRLGEIGYVYEDGYEAYFRGRLKGLEVSG